VSACASASCAVVSRVVVAVVVAIVVVVVVAPSFASSPQPSAGDLRRGRHPRRNERHHRTVLALSVGIDRRHHRRPKLGC
jgi:hypothetical protein